MRINKRWTTNNLLSLALASVDFEHEVNVGEETVAVQINKFTGYTFWSHNGRKTTEENIEEVLARWSVEGV